MSAIHALDQLRQGDTAVVYSLTTNGGIRRRLQDIGLIPGTEVKCVQFSPLGDPIAYLVRGSVIALRREDASRIIING